MCKFDCRQVVRQVRTLSGSQTRSTAASPTRLVHTHGMARLDCDVDVSEELELRRLEGAGSPRTPLSSCSTSWDVALARVAGEGVSAGAARALSAVGCVAAVQRWRSSNEHGATHLYRSARRRQRRRWKRLAKHAAVCTASRVSQGMRQEIRRWRQRGGACEDRR